MFSNKNPQKPGPKGPSHEIIQLVLAIKQRHSQFGYRRIAVQIANDFGVAIDKDVVRRILANRYQPTSKGDGPSWLTFIGQLKDSLQVVKSKVMLLLVVEIIPGNEISNYIFGYG